MGRVQTHNSYVFSTKHSSIQHSPQCHLGLTANLLKGDEFKLSQEVLESQQKQLVVENGKGNRRQATRT